MFKTVTCKKIRQSGASFPKFCLLEVGVRKLYDVVDAGLFKPDRLEGGRMSDSDKIRYPQTRLSLEEIEPVWKKLLAKFHPRERSALENVRTRKRVRMSIFRSGPFMAGETYWSIFSHPLTAKPLNGYRVSPREMNEYLGQFRYGHDGIDLSIFPETLEWLIVINHDGDIFLADEKGRFEID